MKWTIPTVVLLSVGVASADLIHLKDGRVLEGDIRRGDSGWIVTTDGGGRLEIAEDQVARVELRPRTLEGPRGDAVAMSRFQSLKQSLESATDPLVAIDRYRSFIDQYTASRIRAAGVDTLHGLRLAGSNRSLAAYRRSPHPIDRGNCLDLKGSRSSTSKLPADVTGRNRLCTARLKLFGSSRTAVFNPARTMKYRFYCVF